MSKLYDLLSAICGKIKKPDWNQNDSAAADYVKNRPFYSEITETVLVEESTVPFTSPVSGIYYARIQSAFKPTAGEAYKVYWDSVAYECVCKAIDGYSVIGNSSIMGVGADTGEPFVINPLGNGNDIDIFTKDTSASHTFSISGFVGEVVKIPDKYISDTFRDIIIAGNPLKWSDDEWANYYDLFLCGKLLQITTIFDGIRRGYALSMWVDSLRHLTFIDDEGNLYRLAVNNRTGELYWRPLFTTTGSIYLGYQQNASNPTSSTIEYAELSSIDAVLEFTTQKANGNNIRRKVLLEGDKELVLTSSTQDSTKKFRITVDDSGKPTFTNSSDSTDSYTPTDLPTVTASDSGKFLRVSSTGEWVAETISNASGVSF